MMKIKAKKGCINPDCIMCHKKKHAEKTDEFCSKCGMPLSYVCEKCHTVLDDGSTKLCVICQANKDDAKEKRKGVLGKIGAGAGAVAAAIPAVVVALGKKK